MVRIFTRFLAHIEELCTNVYRRRRRRRFEGRKKGYSTTIATRCVVKAIEAVTTDFTTTAGLRSLEKSESLRKRRKTRCLRRERLSSLRSLIPIYITTLFYSRRSTLFMSNVNENDPSSLNPRTFCLHRPLPSISKTKYLVFIVLSIFFELTSK